MTIKNKHYLKFKNTGEIETFSKDLLEQVIENIQNSNTKHKEEAICLNILLYYTGARPGEVLRLKSNDIDKDGQYVKINMPTLKRGRFRTIYIPLRKDPFIKRLYSYSSRLPFEMLLFYHFIGNHKRVIKWKTKNGYKEKEYIEISYKLRYHFSKWYKGIMNIPPYFLRHNRFSKLSMKGATLQDIMHIKGGKDIKSAQVYMHLSSASGKKIGKLID